MPKKPSVNPADLDLIFEIGSLRRMPRAWNQFLGNDVASDLEHTVRVMYLALIIARMEGGTFDEGKIMKMALVHDLAETRTGDHNYLQKAYVQLNESEAVHDSLSETTLVDFLDLLKEYETRTTKEAQIVKDADNLDIDVELKEYEEAGSKLAEKWVGDREIVYEQLFTDSARHIWRSLKTADPSHWHSRINKFTKLKKK